MKNVIDFKINIFNGNILQQKQIIKDAKWYEFSKKRKASLNIRTYRKCIRHLINKL